MSSINSLGSNNNILPQANTSAPAAVAPKTTDAPAADRVELQGSSYKLGGYEKLIAPRTELASAPISVSVYLKGAQPSEVAGEASKPTSAELNDVKQFAEANGLNIASVDADTHVVKLTGNAAEYQKAFGVKLEEYKAQDGQIFHAYEGNLNLPKDIAGSVATVVGLNNRAIAHPHTSGFLADDKAAPASGYNPADVAKAYHFPANTDGKGQNIAIVELGGGYKQADTDAYFKGLHLPTVQFHDQSVDGAKNAPEGSLNGADGEVYLDVEVVGAVAPGANIEVDFAPNSAQGFIDGVNEAAQRQIASGHPGAISVSWGAPEGAAFSSADEQAFNTVLKNAADHGVNVYVASGDNGSVDGARDGKNHPDFPSASPWTVSTGGTKLETDSKGEVGTEISWTEIDQGQGASGGGVSNSFPVPDYQSKAGIHIPNNDAGKVGRGVPDISGNAAPDSGYRVQGEGSRGSIGGTSAVAPLISALDARERQAVGGNIGFLNPTLYAHPEISRDIDDGGSNGAYTADKGWDAVTGLGVADGEKLLTVLKAKKAAEEAAAAGTNPPQA